MKIRFDLPVAVEASRDDMMRVHYAPGRRPGIPSWRWHILLALLLLPFAWSATLALRSAVTLELEGRAVLPVEQAGRTVEVMATMGIGQASLLVPGRSAQVRFSGEGWTDANVVAVRLVESRSETDGGAAAVAVWLRLVRGADVGVGRAGHDRPVAVRFSLLQDMRVWWKGWATR